MPSQVNARIVHVNLRSKWVCFQEVFEERAEDDVGGIPPQETLGGRPHFGCFVPPVVNRPQLQIGMLERRVEVDGPAELRFGGIEFARARESDARVIALSALWGSASDARRQITTSRVAFASAANRSASAACAFMSSKPVRTSSGKRSLTPALEIRQCQVAVANGRWRLDPGSDNFAPPGARRGRASGRRTIRWSVTATWAYSVSIPRHMAARTFRTDTRDGPP